MHNLLYYPNFEIQDQNFLKFALLYIDEIRPIIPYNARDSLSESMQKIMEYTNLINPYAPNMYERVLASEAAVQHLENQERRRGQYSKIESRHEIRPRNYALYSDKFTYLFENYCLYNNLAEECDYGILLSKDIAYIYMSILAGIISKEIEIDMITDNMQYTDPTLRYVMRRNRTNIERLDKIRNEIQFHVPVDMRNIPLERFIELRSDAGFETARKNYVRELNKVLDSYDNEVDVDLRNLIECREEIYGLFTRLFVGCASAIVIASSLVKLRQCNNEMLNFWSNAGSIAVSVDTLRDCAYGVEKFAKELEGKRQARKYLARLRHLR